MTLPSMGDLISGRKLYSDIKPIEIEDLLGRNSVAAIEGLLNKNIKDKVILITGAGGSIGSEICRQVFKQKPKKILLFELSEFSLYSIEGELDSFNHQKPFKIELVSLLGSVQNKKLLLNYIEKFKVQQSTMLQLINMYQWLKKTL